MRATELLLESRDIARPIARLPLRVELPGRPIAPRVCGVVPVRAAERLLESRDIARRVARLPLRAELPGRPIAARPWFARHQRGFAELYL